MYGDSGGHLTKTLLALKQHPELKLAFVFTNPDTPLSKGSKSTYRSWCEKQGIACFKIGSSELEDYIKQHKA